MIIAGIVITTIGTLILAFPWLKSEEERSGHLVKPTGKGKDQVQINKSLQRVANGKPYFWTDRKIRVVGAIVTLLGMALLTLGETVCSKP
jgi:hypothetical protein